MTTPVYYGLIAIGLVCYLYSHIGLMHHVRSRNWVLTQAELLPDSFYEVRETDYRSDDPRSFGRIGPQIMSKFVAEYRYTFQGKPYSNNRLSFYDNKSYVLGGDTYWKNITEQLTKNDGRFEVYVNPDNPNESVVIREIRWLAAGSYFAVGFFFIFLGLLGLFPSIAATGAASPQAAQLNIRVIVAFIVVGCNAALVSPLLWRDKYFLLALLAWLPLLLGLNGLLKYFKQP
jgi:hypothetical protein